MTKTAIYRRWQSMRQRCENPKNSEYGNYGGRGITVDPAWACFDAFLADMGEDFSPELEIERVDGERGYSKENCIWATRQTQQRNKRTNHRLTLGEETMTIVEWGERLKIKPNTILTRIRRGWPVGKALGLNA